MLGGTAELWQRRPPGPFIPHASRIGYAMGTLDEPLLAPFARHGLPKSDLVMPLDGH